MISEPHIRCKDMVSGTVLSSTRTTRMQQDGHRSQGELLAGKALHDAVYSFSCRQFCGKRR